MGNFTNKGQGGSYDAALKGKKTVDAHGHALQVHKKFGHVSTEPSGSGPKGIGSLNQPVGEQGGPVLELAD